MSAEQNERAAPSRILGGAGKRRLRLARPGLHGQAADALRRSIIRGELAPGATLVESDLCKELGVSRTPLREALKLLAAEGLVELRPNRSPRIREMLPDETRELFEAIGGIERLAAELAARRITPRELQRLRVLQDSMERHHSARALEAYFGINQQIHRLIVASAKNTPLQEVHESLLARAERARLFALSARGRWDQSVEEHRAVLKALEEHAPEEAGRILGDHVCRTGNIVCDVLRSQASPLPDEPSGLGTAAA
jgi:DNA-binding GntR family transcriptional regulator